MTRMITRDRMPSLMLAVLTLIWHSRLAAGRRNPSDPEIVPSRPPGNKVGLLTWASGIRRT